MSADIRQAHRWPPAAWIMSSISGTGGTSSAAICWRIMRVAIACMPGSPDTAVGMWVAGLPTGENWRFAIVFLLMISKPQKVKNRCVSMPSPRAALARIRPG